MTLCEFVLDIAQDEVNARMKSNYEELVCQLSDEIIATAEEYEP